jgi:mRNA interferase MazF
MGSFTVGDVVLVVFPYADLSAFKKRPALILSQAEFGNFITCQITSKAATSSNAISLSDADFLEGGLKVDSYIRPDKIFTLEASVIQGRVGTLTPAKLNAIKDTIRSLFV